QRRPHLQRHGIAPRRIVEGDPADRAVLLGQHLVGVELHYGLRVWRSDDPASMPDDDCFTPGRPALRAVRERQARTISAEAPVALLVLATGPARTRRVARDLPPGRRIARVDVA